MVAGFRVLTLVEENCLKKRKRCSKLTHTDTGRIHYATRDNVFVWFGLILWNRWINCLITAIQKYKKHQKNPPDYETGAWSQIFFLLEVVYAFFSLYLKSAAKNQEDHIRSFVQSC